MEEIYVTRPFLPPQEEFFSHVQSIWRSNQLTNQGPLVSILEKKLAERFSVKHFFLTCNGMIALHIAIKACNIQGEIITTPFSFVATTSSIVWENCTPIFADIDPETLCIDPSQIEKKITSNTTAILATHVYGGASDVAAIEKIAKKNNLYVIYDAAHAFDVRYDGRALVNYGDISVLSFHATKVFHTAEGGAIMTNRDDLAEKILLLRNFGLHQGDVVGLGTNGKLSEFHAAMGLAVLPYVDENLAKRKKIIEWYDKILLSHQAMRKPAVLKTTENNVGYYPVIFSHEQMLLDVESALNARKIFPRRYFYPSLNCVPFVKYDSMPVAEDISRRVLCLPLYPELSEVDVKKISGIILGAMV